MAEIDPHENIKGTAFTHQCYTQVYPAVDPTLPEHSQTGKVIVITGASRGLGQEVGSHPMYQARVILCCKIFLKGMYSFLIWME